MSDESNESEKIKKSGELSMEELEGYSDSYMEMSEDDVAVEGTSFTGNKDYYRPSLKNENVKGNAYQAMIRPIINFFEAPRKVGEKIIVPNIYDKFIYFLQDPDAADKSFMVDCPSNWGENNNPVSTAYLSLWKHESHTLREVAKEFFKRKMYYYSLALIITDEQQPDLVGQIKIFRFGTQIMEKITQQSKENAKFKKKGVVVFDAFAGKDLVLIIKEEQVEFNGKKKTITGYSSSFFHDETSAIEIKDLGIPFEKSKENMGKLMAYVRENAPDLTQVKPIKWDEELEKKVIRSIYQTIGDEEIFNEIMKTSYRKSRKGEWVRPSWLDEKAGSSSGTNDGMSDDGLKKHESPKLRGVDDIGDQIADVDDVSADIADTAAKPVSEEETPAPIVEEAKEEVIAESTKEATEAAPTAEKPVEKSVEEEVKEKNDLLTTELEEAVTDEPVEEKSIEAPKEEGKEESFFEDLKNDLGAV